MAQSWFYLTTSLDHKSLPVVFFSVPSPIQWFCTWCSCWGIIWWIGWFLVDWSTGCAASIYISFFWHSNSKTSTQVNTQPENSNKWRTASGDEKRLDCATRPNMRCGKYKYAMRNIQCGMPELQQSASASSRITTTSNKTVDKCKIPATAPKTCTLAALCLPH